MHLLLRHHSNRIVLRTLLRTFTNGVVESSSGNNLLASELADYLLQHYDDSMELTMVLLIKLTTASIPKMRRFLLKYESLSISETMLTRLVKCSLPKAQMDYLLSALYRNGCITAEALIRTTVECRVNPTQSITWFLHISGPGAVVSEEILKAAVKNRGNGREFIAFLLDRVEDGSVIIEAILEAAAGNIFNGEEFPKHASRASQQGQRRHQ
jgi:hypothetical protein